MIVFVLSEIGTGWGIAMMNSSVELEFIGKHHKMLNNNVSYWIGGATLAEGNINYSDYMVHSPCPGNLLLSEIKLWLLII